MRQSDLPPRTPDQHRRPALQRSLLKDRRTGIDDSTRAQSNLIAELLDISRIVAGKLRLEPRALNFVACLESAINNVRPLATENESGQALTEIRYAWS